MGDRKIDGLVVSQRKDLAHFVLIKTFELLVALDDGGLPLGRVLAPGVVLDEQLAGLHLQVVLAGDALRIAATSERQTNIVFMWINAVLDDMRAAKWYAQNIKPTLFNQQFLNQLDQTIDMIQSQMK